MTTTPLLSQQLLHLSPSTLTQPVATERARLKRRLRADPELTSALESWALTCADERAAADEGRPHLPEDKKSLKAREILARRVSRGLQQLSRRIGVERPNLSGYTEMLNQLKSPVAYVPDPCPYEPFESRTEENDPEYAKLLKEAEKRALIKAERTFTYQQSLTVRSFAMLIGLIGIVVLVGSRVHSWEEPSTQDALLLLAVNLILTSGVIHIHIHRRKREAFRTHLREVSNREETETRREIERRERARLNIFLENSRRRREAYEATDADRRAVFERMENKRIEYVRRIITGQEVNNILSSLLPLALPLKFAHSQRTLSDGRLELQLMLPSLSLLPPSIDGLTRFTRVAPTPMDRELEAQILPLAAAVAIRHLSELFFHLPTLRSARVIVMRPTDAKGEGRVPLVHAEGDRRAVSAMSDHSDPMELLRSVRSRVYFEHVGMNTQERAAS